MRKLIFALIEKDFEMFNLKKESINKINLNVKWF